MTDRDHRVEYDAYNQDDVAERALTLRGDETDCPGGEWCPTCRVAKAVTQLTGYFNLPFDWGDDLIVLMVSGLPGRRPWTRDEAHEMIRNMSR